MRIVAIRGKNLASLKGEFQIELDQPPLSNLGLFSIHGPVGSGKSTLLDALCLGLFGRTPRLSGSGGAPLVRGDDDVDNLKSNAPATLVRRGAKDAYAEVDFIGKDGRLYRARWDIRRGRTPKGAKPGAMGRLQAEQQSLRAVARVGDVDAVTGVAAADVMLGDTNSEVRRLVEDRLGLSFDELCRSVLLAQGGFQSFLSAKPAERAELLEKVTGTAIYSRLSVAAYEKARAIEAHLDGLRVQLAANVVLDPDARSALERDIVEKKSEAATTDALISALSRRRDQKLAAVDVSAGEAALVAANAASVRADVAATEAIADRDERRATLAALQPLFVEVRRAHAAAQQPLRRADEAARTLADAEIVAARAAADADVAAHAVAALRAAMATDVGGGAVDVDVAALGGAYDALMAWADAATVGSGATAMATAAAAESALASEATARKSADAARADIVAAISDVVGAHFADDDAFDVDAACVAVSATVVAALDDATGRAIDRAAAQVDAISGVVVRLDAAVAIAAAHDAIAAARKALVDGEPCVVCGSDTHPHAHHDLGAQATAVREQLAAERSNLLILQRNHEALLSAQKTLRPRRDRLLAKAKTQPAGPAWTLPTDVDALRALFEKTDDFDALRDAHHRAQAALAAAAADSAAATSAHVAQVMQLELHQGTVERARAAAQAACVVAGVVLDGIAEDTTGSQAGALRRIAAGLSKRIRDAAARAARQAEHQQALAEAEARAVACAQRAHEATRRRDDAALVSVERAAAKDDATAAVALAEAAVAGRGDEDAFARDVASADAKADAAVIAQRRAALALATAQAQLRERRDRLHRLGGDDSDGVTAIDDSDGVTAIDVAIDDAKARAHAARDAAATLKAQLIHDDDRQRDRERLSAQLAQTAAEGETWQQLGQLIGAADGGRFRQFAQGLTLDALVTHANVHLAVLQPRYRLRRTQSEQQKHDLDLVIVDSEAGGDVRSTQTLSGGETFLVSLALALGLSSLSANEGARGRVESLFIDEGFSALDQETLDVALAAFDALRQTGRQIGVISHVPLLVERLGAQVRVVPMGGGASRVEVHAS
jgi:exonuclease SbcC